MVPESEAVVELEVRRGHWLAGRTLAEARLRDEGEFIGTPRGDRRVALHTAGGCALIR